MRLSLFHDALKPKSGDGEEGGFNPGVALVKKLLSVLEYAEKLPVLTHDTPGAGHGLKILVKPLKFRLKRCPDEE